MNFLGVSRLKSRIRVRQMSLLFSSLLRLQLLCVNHMQLVHKLVAGNAPCGIRALALVSWGF